MEIIYTRLARRLLAGLVEVGMEVLLNPDSYRDMVSRCPHNNTVRTSKKTQLIFVRSIASFFLQKVVDLFVVWWHSFVNDMSKPLQFDELIDAKYTARQKRETKMLTRLEKREAQADKMVGELVRDGKTICYTFPPGGAYREGSRTELVAFLIRRRYV